MVSKWYFTFGYKSVTQQGFNLLKNDVHNMYLGKSLNSVNITLIILMGISGFIVIGFETCSMAG